MKTYIDEKGGNMAKIAEVKIYPHKGASKKATGYRLTLYAMYDNQFIYHVSCYETMEEAINRMNNYGDWEEV